MTNKPSIGFIGLGLMGSAMVQRLIDCGYPVTVIANRSRANVDKAGLSGRISLARADATAALTSSTDAKSTVLVICPVAGS